MFSTDVRHSLGFVGLAVISVIKSVCQDDTLCWDKSQGPFDMYQATWMVIKSIGLNEA